MHLDRESISFVFDFLLLGYRLLQFLPRFLDVGNPLLLSKLLVQSLRFSLLFPFFFLHLAMCLLA